MDRQLHWSDFWSNGPHIFRNDILDSSTFCEILKLHLWKILPSSFRTSPHVGVWFNAKKKASKPSTTSTFLVDSIARTGTDLQAPLLNKLVTKKEVTRYMVASTRRPFCSFFNLKICDVWCEYVVLVYDIRVESTRQIYGLLTLWGLFLKHSALFYTTHSLQNTPDSIAFFAQGVKTVVSHLKLHCCKHPATGFRTKDSE